jgi:hypothetical protein
VRDFEASVEVQCKYKIERVTLLAEKYTEKGGFQMTELSSSISDAPQRRLAKPAYSSRLRIAGLMAATLMTLAFGAGCAQDADTSNASSAGDGSSTRETTTTALSYYAWERVLSSAVGKPKDEYSTYQWAKEPGLGVVEFQFVADENLSDNLTSRGAKMDVVKILEEVQDVGRSYSAVSVTVVYPYVDTFGKVTIQNIAELTYPKSTIDRIQFKTIDAGTIYTIASPSKVMAEWR